MGGLGYYLATAALGLAAFAAGFALARRSRRAALAAAGVVLGLVVLKAVLHWRPEWEAALFPWVDYVYFQGYWLYPTALLFFGLATGQLPVRWNRAVVASVAAAVFAHSLWAGRWMVVPLDDSSTRRADARHHCRQSSGYTCVPAACVSFLSHLGINATEGEMARLCLTRRRGTTFFNTYRGLVLKLDGRPFDVRIVRLDVRALRALGGPAVVAVRFNHAGVVWFEGDRALLSNPLRPEPEPCGDEELERILHEAVVVALRRPRGDKAMCFGDAVR